MQDTHLGPRIDKIIASYNGQLKTLRLRGQDSLELYYNEEDEVIYGTVLLERDMTLSIAHDIDDKEDSIVVFNLFHDENLLMSNITKLDLLVKHLSQYL